MTLQFEVSLTIIIDDALAKARIS